MSARRSCWLCWWICTRKTEEKKRDKRQSRCAETVRDSTILLLESRLRNLHWLYSIVFYFLYSDFSSSAVQASGGGGGHN